VASQAVTVRIARWSANHPWRAILIWIVFVAVCLGIGSFVGTRSATDADYRVGEAGHALAIQAAGGIVDPTVENVLISAAHGRLDTAAANAAAADVTARMHGLADVSGVAKPVLSHDGTTLLVAVTMKQDGADAENHVQPLLDQTAAAQAAHPNLRIAETGDASQNLQVDDQDGQDTAKAEQLSLPITLIILLVAFGAIVAAGVPLLVALSAVGAAMGLSVLSTHAFPSVGENNTMIVLIGMAVGVDYSLFYLRREREERARSGGRISHTQAVELAAATSGRAIIVSGIAVLVSVAALFFADDIIFSSLAVSVMIVVAIAMVASLTVLPAVLAKLGRWVDRPRVPLVHRLTNRQGPPRLWPALLRPATRHPAITFAVATLAMIGLAVPVFGMRLGLASNDRLPQVPAIHTYNELVQAFPEQGTAFFVAIRDGSADRGELAAAVTALEQQATHDPLLAGKTTPVVRTSKDGTISTITFGTPYAVDAPQSNQLLHSLDDRIVPNTIGRVAGADYAVGGDVAMDAADVTHLDQKLPIVVAFLILLTFVMMVIAFRSLTIGLISAGLNILSAGAALGLLVTVFQSDWAARLMDLPPGGFIISRVPLFLFVILFGLSMDYQVFVVSRIREAALRGVPTRQAVAEGITSSAGVVTSAAIVMVSVFAGFVFGGLLEIKQVGFGLAVGILLDAFVVRILILPSLMTLLGNANWWPSRGVRKAQLARSEGRPVALPERLPVH
jgi:RND superfamily putative drug exporter